MEFKLSNIKLDKIIKWSKVLVIVGGGLVIGLSTYAMILYYNRKKETLTDEGFEDNVKLSDEPPERKILVLGLDGAGKSSFLHNLSKTAAPRETSDKTCGFNIVSFSTENGINMNFWEIGGSESFRKYWSNFLLDTDVLVFVVDATDVRRLSEVVLELHKLSADERLQKVPFLILANKQDISGALSSKDVTEALGIVDLLEQGHKVEVLPLQVPAELPYHFTVDAAKNLVSAWCCRK
ncbi:uncharacterized protein LOC143253684 isoform X2 [Tachypleus tridentatus]|uniref:uncharacterized protein LOC143253684 isoform X2 n=1 Tax=Tachypleus tridentatus TaxID=6853 RepID=UPI003FCF48CA